MKIYLYLMSLVAATTITVTSIAPAHADGLLPNVDVPNWLAPYKQQLWNPGGLATLAFLFVTGGILLSGDRKPKKGMMANARWAGKAEKLAAHKVALKQVLPLSPAPPAQPQAPGQAPAATPSLHPSGCVCLAPNCGWSLTTRRCAATALAALAPGVGERGVRTWRRLAWRRCRRWLLGLPARFRWSRPAAPRLLGLRARFVGLPNQV